MGMGAFALGVVLCSWVAFGVRLAVNHARVRRLRGPEPAEERKHDLRAPLSMLGLLLEGVAIAIVFAMPRDFSAASTLASTAATLMAIGSFAFASAAVGHLGMQWRVKAVVTRNHELITTGPYAVVRHPIYLALFGFTLASGLLLTPFWRLMLAIAVYVCGTEIRVFAEETILRQRFGEEFDTYRARVAAYLPYVR